jgi:hypothetical protein
VLGSAEEAMVSECDWSKEAYEASVTSRCWSSTPYDAGWDESKKHGEDLPASRELRAIFDEEMALDAVPDWAVEIIDRMIASALPMCGHYAFPRPVLQVCEAIGEERCPEFVVGCYTAEPGRKVLMSYYVFCLDAWLKGAPLDVAKAELALRDDLGKDWGSIVEAVYATLGEPTDKKTLLMRRLIHRLRWWIKSLLWLEDRRDVFMLDVYSGDIRGHEAKWGAYGNSPFGDPYFAERRLPEIRKLDRQIRDKVPDGEKLLERIESTWLCAPKVFRYLEKLICEIGGIDSDGPPDYGQTILQCEDTYPDMESCREWYSSFMASLTEWLAGNAEAMPELGAATPVKHWLARILRHKLDLYERHDSFGKLVGTQPSGKSGTMVVCGREDG